jgi:hypothetical protein
MATMNGLLHIPAGKAVEIANWLEAAPRDLSEQRRLGRRRPGRSTASPHPDLATFVDAERKDDSMARLFTHG